MLRLNFGRGPGARHGLHLLWCSNNYRSKISQLSRCQRPSSPVASNLHATLLIPRRRYTVKKNKKCLVVLLFEAVSPQLAQPIAPSPVVKYAPPPCDATRPALIAKRILAMRLSRKLKNSSVLLVYLPVSPNHMIR